ncbi:TPA: chorismate mutase [Streptococcus suis]|nr:chorismate mutase [Streptococcus suis]
MNLDQIRQEINQLDSQLVRLLEQRMHLVDQVTAFKRQSGMAVLDSNREEEVLNRVTNLVENPTYQASIRATFADIMSHSRAYQTEQLQAHEK